MRAIKVWSPVAVVLCLVLGLALSPSIMAGFWDLNQAESLRATDPLRASEKYESAARHLPWRKDLLAQAYLAALAGNDPGRAMKLRGGQVGLSPAERLALGDAFYRIGDKLAAINQWEKIRGEGPVSAELYNRLGHAYYESGNFDLAIEDFDHAQQLDAFDADSRYTLGLLLATRSPELALSPLLRAAQIDPKLSPVMQNLRQGLSAALLSANLDDQLVGAGRTLAGAGDWKLGHEAFSNAVKENPSNALAWAWLGLARQILGGDGLTELDRAVNLDPASAEIHGLRGLFFLRGNQYEKARDEFQSAADLEPSNPGWQVSLGDALARTGNVPQGLERYQNAVDLSPRSAEYWRLLANFTVDYNFDMQEIGFPAALQARALAPDDPQNSVTLGRLYFSSGDMDSAEKIWLETLKTHPELADAHLYLGILYLQQGKNDPAQSHLTSAEELDPSGAYGDQAGRLLEQYFP